MSAMIDPSPSSTAWPAARPTGISPIQHPAWEAARNAILDLAADGPITAVIVGQPGTGKTWLLRELASALGDHGFPTMMLMQGNLPMALSNGAALLVDEASLMSETTRAELSAQQHGVCVLAGVEWIEDEFSPAPVIIPLRPLDPDEIADFAAEWLHRAGVPSILDASTLSHLTAQSGGRVGTIVRLLGEAVATLKRPEVTPPAAPLPSIPPRRRTVYRPALAIAAIAATIALGWALVPTPPPTRSAQIPAPPPTIADAAPAIPPAPPPVLTAAATTAAPPALPALRAAETADPVLVTAAATPLQPSIAPPPLAASPTPDLDANLPPDSDPATAVSAIAAADPPPVQPLADPTIVATLDDPTAPAPARPLPPIRTAVPGLVIVAQRGDTLERLYDSVYRDRKAPSFATVLAANPGPFKPGAIVVFPEPPGGWQRIQR